MTTALNSKIPQIIHLLLVVVLFCPFTYGKVIYVDDDGSADFSTIQAAIDDANDGDTVLVAPGIYTGDGNRDIDFKGKAITIKSEEGPQTCIIDCQGTEEEQHRGFYFHSGEDANSVLQGITIINGFVGEGGAIFCEGSSPTICECTIRLNTAQFQYNMDYEGNGGGIYCSYSEALIKDCKVIENSAIPRWLHVATGGRGGGVYCSNGNQIITGCDISNNSSAANQSGAVFCRMSDIKIDDCIFNSNKSNGICFEIGNLNVAGCTITNHQCNGISNYKGNLKITDCMIDNNQDSGLKCNSSNEVIIKSCDISKNQGNGVSCSSNNEVITKKCNISKNRYNGIVCGWDNNILIEQCLVAANMYSGIDCSFVDRLSLNNCTIVHNKIAGISCDDGSTNSSIRNSIIWENQIELDKRWLGNPLCTISYSNVQGALESVEITRDYPLKWGEGNINLDPNFVNPGKWDPNGTKWSGQDDIWIEGDYHLKSQVGRWDPVSGSWVVDDVTSPCINAGDPNMPVGDEPMPNDGRINMGAYGGTCEASKS